MGSKIVSDLLRPINTSGIILLGVFSVIWGLWVVNPFWNVFDRAPVYEALAYAPEWAWGAAAVIVGVAMLAGVFFNSYESLTRGAKAGFYFWLIVAILFFVGDWQNTGGLAYLLITVYCAFVWVNIKVNRRNYHFREDA